MVFFKRKKKMKIVKLSEKEKIKKENFYNIIKKLRDQDYNKIYKLKNKFNIEQFEINFKRLLKEYNCSFGYQNKNSKKHGHVKRKLNIVTGQEIIEMKIEENENVAGKIYTIIHEFTHLINNHLISKDLTYKQKEVVADTVALMIINLLNMKSELENSNLSKKWDIDSYSKNYIYNMACSPKREKDIVEQIKNSFYFLSEKLF